MSSFVKRLAIYCIYDMNIIRSLFLHAKGLDYAGKNYIRSTPHKHLFLFQKTTSRSNNYSQEIIMVKTISEIPAAIINGFFAMKASSKIAFFICLTLFLIAAMYFGYFDDIIGLDSPKG